MDRWSRLKANGAFGAAFAVFAALMVRLYDIQVGSHAAYAAVNDRQSTAFIDLRGPRGTIVDRTGAVMAISVARPSVGVDPVLIASPIDAIPKLAAALHIDGAVVAAAINKRLPDGRSARFAWLKRFATPEEADAVRALKLKGVVIETEYDRVYPAGTLLSQVLGIVNGDDEGGEGLERMKDLWLKSERQRFEALVDAKRRKLDHPGVLVEGDEVELAIDARFQRIAEEELDAAIAQFKPKWAAVVAIDPKTGAILAMTCRPTFDPNVPVPAGMEPRRAADARRNRAITDPFEPGSTFKPFVVAWAMEQGLIKPDTRFDCEMGAAKFGPRTVHDHHPYGILPVTDIVAKSSNIGAIKIGMQLGKQKLHDGVHAFGFGARNGIDLPAENGGIVHPLGTWSIYSMSSIPMGHEIAVTPLQLAAAMAAIANGGWLLKPRVVHRVGELAPSQRTEIRRVLSAKTCAQMKAILAEVMKTGTGKDVKVEGVTLAGKTGTTQKLDRHGTRYGYISTFAGFAPVEDPKAVIVVVVDEPQGAYYGSAVAAPVFAGIVKRGLGYLK